MRYGAFCLGFATESNPTASVVRRTGKRDAEDLGARNVGYIRVRRDMEATDFQRAGRVVEIDIEKAVVSGRFRRLPL